MALLWAQKALRALGIRKDSDEAIGVNIVRRALEEPVRPSSYSSCE